MTVRVTPLQSANRTETHSGIERITSDGHVLTLHGGRLTVPFGEAQWSVSYPMKRGIELALDVDAKGGLAGWY